MDRSQGPARQAAPLGAQPSKAGCSELLILSAKTPSGSETMDLCTSPAGEVFSAITCRHDTVTTGWGSEG